MFFFLVMYKYDLNMVFKNFNNFFFVYFNLLISFEKELFIFILNV